MLPLKNLLEVVCLRIADAESLDSLVVSLSHIVGYVIVVVLGCTGVDVNDARRNLSCLRVLQVCKIERRNVAVCVNIDHASCLAFAEELVNTHCKLCAICKVISDRVLAADVISDFYRTALHLKSEILELLLEKVIEEDSL